MNDLNKSGAGRPQISPQMLRNSKNIVCECGGLIFSEKLFFKKISAIISPSGKEEVAPMPIIVCEACGKVPSAFDTQKVLPEEIKAVKETSTRKDFYVKGDIIAEGDIKSMEDIKLINKDGTPKTQEQFNEENN